MKKNITLVLVCFISLQLFCQQTPFEALPNIMRGINLGNTLECDSLEGQWHLSDPIEWSDNGLASESYFDAYKQAGFQSVRIPITWDTHTLKTSPYTIDPVWMKRVEEIVDWGLKRNMYVIINAHHDTWIKEQYSDLTNQARFDSIWSQVATYFKDKNDSLFFEILNEPNGLTISQVNELNARVLGIIRKTNPTRNVLFTGNNWANVDDLLAVTIPNDKHLFGYYHSYDPWGFAGLGQGTWGTTDDIKALRDRLDKAKTWVDKNNIPVIIGEYGTDTLCDYNSRMLYLSYYVEEAKKRNLALNVWDDGGTFQVYRRKTNTWHDTKEIFIHFSELSPNLLSFVSGDNAITVSWTNRITNADSILIERRASTSSFKKIVSLDANQNSYSDVNLVPEDFYYYRIVTYRNDSAFYSYPQRFLLIPMASERKPFTGTAIQIPGTFQVEDFDKGGYGLTYFDKDMVRKNDLYRLDKGLDIDSLIGGSLGLVDNKTGEWYDYSIHVAQSLKYQLTFYVGSTSGKGNISFIIDGDKSSSQAKYIYPSVALSSIKPYSLVIQIPEGNHILRMNMASVSGLFFLDSISITEPTVSDIVDSENNSAFVLSSNIVESELTVLSKKQNCTIADIAIYTVNGKKLIDLQNEKIPFVQSLEELALGVYFITITSDDNIETIRFVKK